MLPNKCKLIQRAIYTAILLIIGPFFNFPAFATTRPAVVNTLFKLPGSDAGGIGSLIRDSAGNFYGTYWGHNSACGMIFKLTLENGVWKKNNIHIFSNKDGCSPNSYSKLLRDTKGNLYGATMPGEFPGVYIFKLSPPIAPNTQWAETIIFSNPEFNNQYSTVSDLSMDGKGVLYGTTFRAGLNPSESNLLGSFFQLTPPAAGQSKWQETTLLKFHAANALPMNAVAQGADGAFYGLSFDRGPGAVYRVEKAAGVWRYTIIHRFSRKSDDFACCALSGRLLVMPSGEIYGTAPDFQDTGGGSLFKLTPPKAGATAWNFATLYRLGDDGQPEGRDLQNPLLADSTGALYGTTDGIELSQNRLPYGLNDGSVIRFAPPVSPSKKWTSKVIGVFKSGDGVLPNADLMMDSSGSIFGSTFCTKAMPFSSISAGCGEYGGSLYEIPKTSQ